MKEIIKNVIIMTIFCIAAGVGLGAVYGITKPLIEANEEAALQKSLAEVIDASEFIPTEMDDAMLAEIANMFAEYDIDEAAAKINTLYAALDEAGDLVGYNFDVSEMEGYGGEINFIVGINLDGEVTGVSILKINETAGLGMKAKDDTWRSQFYNKPGVTIFEVTKTGATNDSQIDAISAATITSKAMTKGVNAALAAFYALGGVNQ